jgi:TolB-like protein
MNIVYAFGPFRLDTSGEILFRGADPLPVGRRAVGVLRALLEQPGVPVSKDALMQAAWPGLAVEDGNLTVQIAALRRALAAEPGAEDWIETLPRRGYRFIGPVARLDIPSVSTTTTTAAPPLPDKPSIVVLPFANLSDDPSQEYVADGMVEDITTALSKLRWFFVIARNSAFTYKGRAVDVTTVGRDLGVRYALEGSVRRGGARLRVTVQLIDAQTGNHVWAERYDRDLADLFEVQDEITERVIAAIEPELYAAEHIRSQRKTPDNLDAWECVVRGLSCIGQGTRAGDLDAEALCRRAIDISPNYGQAHSLLAWALLRRTYWSGGLAAVLPEVTTEVQTALRLDDRDPWAHLTQANLLMRTRHLANPSERSAGRWTSTRISRWLTPLSAHRSTFKALTTKP